MTQLRKIPPRLLDALWCALLAAYILIGTPLIPFHGDESTLIYMGRDYFYQFVQRDLGLVMYSDPPINPMEQDLRLINGTINKYTIGLAAHLNGFTINDLNNPYLWDTTYEYNLRAGHIPNDALLHTARWPSALFLALGVVFMFAIGGAVGGRLTAYLVSLYYALHPVLLLNGRRAMMEGSMIAFSLLVVLAGIYVIRYRAWWAAILLGAAAGLAVASKHNAAFTVFIVFAVCGVWLFIERWRDTERAAVAQQPESREKQAVRQNFALRRARVNALQKPPFGLLIIAGIVAMLVFYALNPAWWGDPVARAQEVLQHRTALLDGQTATFGGYSGLADQIGGFWRQAFIALPQYYEVADWEQNIGDQIARYEASIWRGVAIGGSTIGAILLLIACLIGAWRLLRDNEKSLAIRVLAGAWALAMVVSTGLLSPLEWQRYMLPAYPALGLLAALGTSEVIERLRLITRSRKPTAVQPSAQPHGSINPP